VTPVIEARDVTVSFGGVLALNAVNITVHRGEAVAVVGPNGAGKSTLLNALNGVVRLAKGSIELLGARTDGWPAHRVARLGVHRSFQHPHLLEKESVLRNVMAGGHVEHSTSWVTQVARPLRTAKREAELRHRCRALIAGAHLGQYEESPTGGLSYGVRKLVDIVRATVGQPPILLLDEPSSGLGAEDRHRLIDLLVSIRAHGTTTLVVVEHHMDVVSAVADRVVALTQGVLTVDSPITEVDDLESLGVADVLPEDTAPRPSDRPAHTLEEIG
jgi:ABC-type branched-subunit amino acid transport system ATPase component